MENKYDLNDLSIIREYFSHNIRTSTAMVVATVMVFKCGLGNDMDNISDIISESAYFLDVYDKGMEILFDFVLGIPVTKDGESVSPSKIVNHLKSKLPLTISEQEIELTADVDEFSFSSNGHIVKALMEIILCEEIRKGRGKIDIIGKNGLYTVSKQTASHETPQIYAVFAKLLKVLNIEFVYDKNRLELRFA